VKNNLKKNKEKLVMGKKFFEEIEDNQDMDENTTIGASDYSDR